jgi:TonB family protein
LGDARLQYANYLNSLHARIHPIFADGFLADLDRLPARDPLNIPTLSTELAFVVDGKTGRLDSAKVSRSSGVPAFDAGALDALKRAFPSAPPHPTTWSSDGKVYVLWEFYRGPEAGGTWNTRPFRFEF